MDFPAFPLHPEDVYKRQIKRLMKEHDVTQPKLADDLHIGQPSISKCLNGKPVSYTHLDVYKRQILYSLLYACAINSLDFFVAAYRETGLSTLSSVL